MNDLKSLKQHKLDTADPKDRNIVNMNRRRVYVEVDCLQPNGATIETARVAQGRSVVEVWEDRVDHLQQERVRTATHETLYAQARELCKAKQQRWLEERGYHRKSPEEIEHYLTKVCPETPERSLYEIGVKNMPPLKSIRICTRDLSASIPYEEWAKTSEEERQASFYIAPPSLPENVGDQQTAYLKQMAELFAKAMAGNDVNGKGRGRG